MQRSLEYYPDSEQKYSNYILHKRLQTSYLPKATADIDFLGLNLRDKSELQKLLLLEFCLKLIISNYHGDLGLGVSDEAIVLQV